MAWSGDIFRGEDKQGRLGKGWDVAACRLTAFENCRLYVSRKQS